MKVVYTYECSSGGEDTPRRTRYDEGLQALPASSAGYTGECLGLRGRKLTAGWRKLHDEDLHSLYCYQILR
jgi:hypothetical protein